MVPAHNSRILFLLKAFTNNSPKDALPVGTLPHLPFSPVLALALSGPQSCQEKGEGHSTMAYQDSSVFAEDCLQSVQNP